MREAINRVLSQAAGLTEEQPGADLTECAGFARRQRTEMTSHGRSTVATCWALQIMRYIEFAARAVWETWLTHALA